MSSVFFVLSNPSDIDKDWVGVKKSDQISNFEIGYGTRNIYNYIDPNVGLEVDDDQVFEEQVRVSAPLYDSNGHANFDRMDPLFKAGISFELDDDDVNDIDVYRSPSTQVRYPGEGWSPYGWGLID